MVFSQRNARNVRKQILNFWRKPDDIRPNDRLKLVETACQNKTLAIASYVFCQVSWSCRSGPAAEAIRT